jgi:hypothetical protein
MFICDFGGIQLNHSNPDVYDQIGEAKAGLDGWQSQPDVIPALVPCAPEAVCLEHLEQPGVRRLCRDSRNVLNLKDSDSHPSPYSVTARTVQSSIDAKLGFP